MFGNINFEIINMHVGSRYYYNFFVLNGKKLT